MFTGNSPSGDFGTSFVKRGGYRVDEDDAHSLDSMVDRSLRSSRSSRSSSSSSSLDNLEVDKRSRKHGTSGVGFDTPSKSEGDTSVLSKSSSASSLRSLISIPSHKTFHSLIHKHEVPRKFLHVSIGFITLWLYTRGIELQQVTPYLISMLVLVGSCDFIRFNSQQFNALYIKAVGFLMREKEVNSINGVNYYLLGLIVVFLVFPKDISVLAVLLLSWADTAASTIGRIYGSKTPKIVGNKSLAGSLGAFGASALSALLLYGYFIPQYNYLNRPGQIMWSTQTSTLPLWLLSLIVGVIGSLSELIDVLDDNLTIPVLSAIGTWILFKVTNTQPYTADVFA